MSEEIKIGDEVIHNTERYVVTAISNGSYFCLRADGKFLGEYFKSVLEKTGKHFDQIVDVLNQVDSHYDEFGFFNPFRVRDEEKSEDCISPTGVESEVSDTAID